MQTYRIVEIANTTAPKRWVVRSSTGTETIRMTYTAASRVLASVSQ